ncbi:MAG: hypothetical protein JXR15_13495 [Shimia sp.]|uniref:hypothetical protein n=1 Tax=Shimia sp. TaxID=1954381 RepID=UPI003B8DD891
MDLERSNILHSEQVLEQLFGICPQLVAKFRAQDPLFDELIEDYLTISETLRNSRRASNETNRQFRSDLLETQRSLEAEIKMHLSKAAQT